MANHEPTRPLGFRLPVELIDRIDAYADHMSGQVPGLVFTRTQAIKVLLEKGLAAAEQETPKRKRRK